VVCCRIPWREAMTETPATPEFEPSELAMPELDTASVVRSYRANYVNLYALYDACRWRGSAALGQGRPGPRSFWGTWIPRADDRRPSSGSASSRQGMKSGRPRRRNDCPFPGDLG